MQGYVPDKDHLAVVFLKAHLQVSDRVLSQSGKENLVGFRDPAERTSQALAIGVLPYGKQYLPYGPLDAQVIHVALPGSVRPPLPSGHHTRTVSHDAPCFA